jgi:hypothetical protein
MHAPDVLKEPNDLVHIIDAHRIGAAGRRGGIVEGIEDIDWHGTGSPLIVSSLKSLDR